MNPNSMIDITDDPHHIGANDFVMARNMAEKLHQHYPGYLWAVTCEGARGVATIRNLALSGEYGVVLHLGKLYGDPHMHAIMRAGGEILERFALDRAKMKRDRVDALPVMPNGTPLFDPTGAKSRVSALAIEAWRKSRAPNEKPQPDQRQPLLERAAYALKAWAAKAAWTKPSA